MNESNELRALLRQFIGTETIYKHSLVGGFTYTDGFRAFLQNAGGGAYWLVDILATEPAIIKGVIEHGLCVGVLEVKAHIGKLTVSKDIRVQENSLQEIIGYKYIDVIYEQMFDYTDCPEGSWKFYLVTSTDGIMPSVLAMLPGEY